MTREELRQLMTSFELNQAELAKLCCVSHASVYKWLESEAVCAAIRPAPRAILGVLAAVPASRRKHFSSILKQNCQPASPMLRGLYVLLRDHFNTGVV